MAWEKVKLGDICAWVASGGTPLTSKADYYSPKEIPWLKTQEVNYCRIYETNNQISKKGLENSSAKLIPANAVIVAMYGQGDTAGRVAINKIPLCTNQACCNLVIDENKADYEFVYYNLCTLYDKLVSLKNGGAQPNLNAGLIKNLEISLPPLSTQKRIADILSAYDDLIENNQKQIKLLEEAAQRLYKQWFIDLRYPGHETTKIVDGLLEGWKKKIVMDFISQEIGGGWGEDDIDQKSSRPAFVIRGADIDGVNHGDFLNIPFRFHSESNLEQRILQDGDIVFEVSGGSKTEGVAKTLLITTRLLEQYSSPVICASFCKKIRPKEGLSQYFYDALQYMRMSGVTSEYDKKSASSIVNYRWKDFLSQQCLMLPSENILRMYDKIAKPIYKSIQTKSIEIEKLKRARNSLLPKLMSGEIEVLHV